MKYISIVIFCLFISWNTTEGQNPYNATATNTSKADQNKRSSFAKSFKYIPMANWTAGMRFMIVPDRLKLDDRSNKLEIVPYRSRKSAVYVGIDQREFEWKEFTFVKIEQRKTRCDRAICKYCYIIFESEGRKYEYPYQGSIQELQKEKGLPFVSSLIYLNDIDKAKDQLIGKRMYLLTHERFADNGEGGKLYTTDKKFVPVTVTNIGIGSRNNPVRIVYKDDLESPYYIDITLSGINTDQGLKTVWFDDIFAMDDPKKDYPSIKEEFWIQIQKGEIKEGMSKKECKLAWGEPLRTNDVTRGPETLEQWVYKRNFLYFKDGLLESIQGYE